MALRGKKAVEQKTRLKLLLSGAAGVGKTMAALQMPRPYIIDSEAGTNHYAKLIEQGGGVVFPTTSIEEVVKEVRALISEKHDFLTLVIDSFTVLFDKHADECESKVGSEFGRHVAMAGRQCKRLWNLISTLDMNVIVTAHSKAEYETLTNERGKKEQVRTGETFDGWRKLDYVFDLWLQLSRSKGSQKRKARVAKTRLAEFPDQEEFEWSYAELVRRYGKERLETGAAPMVLASRAQVEKFNGLLAKLSEEQQKNIGIDRALKDVETVEDLTGERIEKGIKVMEDYLAKLNGVPA